MPRQSIIKPLSLLRPYYGLVLICGSRDWTDGVPIRSAIILLASLNRDVRFIHGGARGADNLSGSIARSFGLSVHIEFADWVGRGRAAGWERNERMLAHGPSLVLGFKDNFDRSLRRGGTEHMLKIASSSGVESWLFSHVIGWEMIA